VKIPTKARYEVDWTKPLHGVVFDDETAINAEVQMRLATIERDIRERMDLLRETADGLQSGEINRFHAANRIRRIANEIARGKS
jgi:hypothetical protein